VKQGLIKKYRPVEKNGPALKGKLIFSKHARVNLIHKERFYTRQSLFDRENVFNQILFKALRLIPAICPRLRLKDSIYNLLLQFPELPDIFVNPETFSKLVFDRKTARYKEAIQIAQMLLLNFRPDISAGHNNVLAILFDMNDLWEEFIFRRLAYSNPIYWDLYYQQSRQFWKTDKGGHVKTIRPDITAYNRLTRTSIVVDTKWKLRNTNTPDDADLKQMFVYNEYWKAKKSILLYPDAMYRKQLIYTNGVFVNSGTADETHSCIAAKISLLNGSGIMLEPNLGTRLWEFLEQEI
jgi:5-methylcytosine-specific restriction enzyme subunit McrC